MFWSPRVRALSWLPFAPLPAVSSWPYLAASVGIHIVYFALVAFSYRKGELSFAYPIMRGTAPVLSAIAAALVLGEWPSLGGWLGVLLVCCIIGGACTLGSYGLALWAMTRAPIGRGAAGNVRGLRDDPRGSVPSRAYQPRTLCLDLCRHCRGCRAENHII